MEPAFATLLTLSAICIILVMILLYDILRYPYGHEDEDSDGRDGSSSDGSPENLGDQGGSKDPSSGITRPQIP